VYQARQITAKFIFKKSRFADLFARFTFINSYSNLIPSRDLFLNVGPIKRAHANTFLFS